MGGDFQTHPSAAVALGVPCMLRGVLLRSQPGSATYVSGSNESLIDWFVASFSLAHEAKRIRVVYGSALAEPRPVVLSFYNCVHLRQFRALIRPEPLPLTQPVGPLLPPPSYARLFQRIEREISAALTSDGGYMNRRRSRPSTRVGARRRRRNCLRRR